MKNISFIFLMLLPVIALGQSRYVDVDVWQNGLYVGTVEMMAEYKDDYADGLKVAMDKYIRYLEEKETKERAEKQRNELNQRLKKLGIGAVPSWMGSAAMEGYAQALERQIYREKQAKIEAEEKARRNATIKNAIESDIMNAYDYAKNITLNYKKELGIKKGSGYFKLPTMLFESQGKGKFVRQEGNVQMIYQFFWPGERNIDYADRYKNYERFSNEKVKNGESWGNIIISRETVYRNTGISATIEWEDEYDNGVRAYYGAEDSNGIDYSVYIESRANKNEASRQDLRRVFDFYKPLLEKCIANSRVTIKKLMNETVILDTEKTKKESKGTSISNSSQKKSSNKEKENKIIYAENKNKLLAEEYFAEGLTLKNQKKYTEALISFNMSVKINPDLMEGYFNIGLMNWLLDNNEEAINNFTKALEFKTDYKPSVPILYLSRGRAKYDQELYSSAIMDLNKSIELRVDDYEAYVFRAKCKIRLGEGEEACLDLKKAKNLGYLEADQLIRYYCQQKK